MLNILCGCWGSNSVHILTQQAQPHDRISQVLNARFRLLPLMCALSSSQQKRHWNFKRSNGFSTFLLLCGYTRHSMGTVRGQRCRISCLLPPERGFQKSISAYQASVLSTFTCQTILGPKIQWLVLPRDRSLIQGYMTQNSRVDF